MRVKIYQIDRADGARAYALLNVDPTAPAEKVLRTTITRRWRRHWISGDMLACNHTFDTQDSLVILTKLIPVGWTSAELRRTLAPGIVEVFVEEAA